MKNKGFTLIEILVVGVIIIILLLIFIPTLLGAPGKARDTKRISDLESIAIALKDGVLRDISYPLTDSCINDADFNDYLAQLGGTMPIDPLGEDSPIIEAGDLNCEANGRYAYVYNPDDSDTYSFGLYARLENPNKANSRCGDLEAEPDQLHMPLNSTDGYCYVILEK